MAVSVAKPGLEMPKNIAALLPKARGKPLPLAQNGKTAAVLMSVRAYKIMAALAEEAAELEEDRYWAARADKIVETETPLGVEESQKFMDEMKKRLGMNRPRKSRVRAGKSAG